MKLSEIINSSASTINALGAKKLRSAFKAVRDAVRYRQKTFSSHSALDKMPAQFRGDLPGLRDLDDTGIRMFIKSASSYMLGTTSTYRGWKAAADDRMRSMNDFFQGSGLQFNSLDEFDEYGKFMGDMQTRAGQMWKFVSDEALDLFREGKRLGVNPEQFMRNFEYWSAHLEELQNVDPIQQKEGSRGLSPSMYAHKLGLESISDFYQNNTGTNVSGRIRTGKKRK